jgi:hypothetical protein
MSSDTGLQPMIRTELSIEDASGMESFVASADQLS